MTMPNASARALLLEFAEWLDVRTVADVDHASPARLVEKFLIARDLELSFLVDQSGMWWVFHPDVKRWICAFDEEEIDAGADEALQTMLACSGRSLFVGFDAGVEKIHESFGIAS